MPQTYNVGFRSLFVTITAWVFILIGMLASASSLLQNAAVAAGLIAGGTLPSPALPLVSGFLVGYLPWVVGAGLVLSVALLASAIGLLLRLDWARRTFIALLALAIVANLLGLWLQHEVLGSVVDTALTQHPLPPEAAGLFDGFVTAARVMAVIMTLAASAVLAWIIRRLMSPGVLQEFV